MLHPLPCLASDWVEEGEVEAGVMRPSTFVQLPNIQTSVIPRVAAEELNTDLADFAPMPACIANAPINDINQAAITAGGMSLSHALAEIELQKFQRVFNHLSLLKRIAGLEAAEGIKTNLNKKLPDRVNAIRKAVGLPPIKKGGKWDWFWNPPDSELLNSMGRGIRHGGKMLASAPGAAVHSIGRGLATPGVPELLVMGALLGVGIPLLIKYGGTGGGGGTGSNPDMVYVEGHFQDGTWVAPHWRSAANNTVRDNWGTYGNVNPMTGMRGRKRYPYYRP